MPEAIDTTQLDRVEAVLVRGPVPLPARSPGQRLRRAFRGALLRLTRPFARYEREVDVALLDALRRQQLELEGLRKRHEERLDRLEQLSEEIIIATQSLHRLCQEAGIDHAAVVPATQAKSTRPVPDQ